MSKKEKVDKKALWQVSIAWIVMGVYTSLAWFYPILFAIGLGLIGFSFIFIFMYLSFKEHNKLMRR